MTLHDPVVVYNASTNVDAQMVRLALDSAGIDAFVSEIIPQRTHNPEVWVQRADFQRAAVVLEEFERKAAERKAAREGKAGGDLVEVTCEECGRTSKFSTVLRGTVEQCQYCGAYVDVEEDDA